MGKLAKIEPSDTLGLAIEHAVTQQTTLAVKQDFQDLHPVEESTESSSPVVDNFLPSPNRLMMFGGLGIVGAIGAGVMASMLLTHRTTVKVQARVEPAGEVQIIQSMVGGTVADILVQNHDSVEANQVIASFENAALSTERTNVEKQMDNTRKNITQIDRELAALEENRAIRRQFQPDVSQAPFEYSQALLLSHRQELNAQLEQQRDRLANVQQQIDEMTVRTPAAGILYELTVDNLGQTVNANEPIATLIPADTALEIKAIVPASDIQTIKVGSPTRVHFPTCKVSNFGFLEGSISSIEPGQVSPNSNSSKTNITSNQDPYIAMVEINKEELNTSPHTCEFLPGTEGELTIITRQEKFFNFFLRKLRLKTNG